MKWASKEEQAAVSEGVVKEKAAVKALISDAHLNLTCSQPWILFSASVMSYCFQIIRTPCAINSWYPGNFVL